MFLRKSGYITTGEEKILKTLNLIDVSRYVSYWTFPRAHWADVDEDNATGNWKILAPALADGTLVGRYGTICRAIRASRLKA
jgi:hypothetical protein